MKVKIDVRLDIPGISKFKNRLAESTPELNDTLKKVVSEALVKLLDQHAKPFNQLVQTALQEVEATGVFKVKDEHKANVYALGNSFFTPEASIRYAAKKAAAPKAEGEAKAEAKVKPAKAEKAEAAGTEKVAAKFEL